MATIRDKLGHLRFGPLQTAVRAGAFSAQKGEGSRSHRLSQGGLLSSISAAQRLPMSLETEADGVDQHADDHAG